MRLVQKEYFTVDELIERWEMSRRDFEYLAENGHLRLSVRLFGVAIERGDIEVEPDGRWFTVPCERGRRSGLFELTERDVHTLFKAGEVLVEHFHAGEGRYCDIAEPSEPICVRPGDLLVRDAERVRAEKWMRGASAKPQKPPAFSQTNDYQQVSCNGLEFHFGPLQAAIVAILHQAFLDGGPWRSGKAILEQAGSASPRMADVFKSQPHWRKLIQSNRRGLYRLVPLDES
jgi:hypothetical protein